MVDEFEYQEAQTNVLEMGRKENKSNYFLKQLPIAKKRMWEDDNLEYFENVDISELELEIQKSNKLNLSFDYLQLNIASPNQIRKWAQRKLPFFSKSTPFEARLSGPILKPDTLNYKGLLPEDFGLFCQITFGPIKDWRCQCGKYAGVMLNKICERCFVELTEARVRRYRMAYVDLSYSCAHYWYIKGTTSYMSLILSVVNDAFSKQIVEDIVYFRPLEENFAQKLSELDDSEVNTQEEYDAFLARWEKERNPRLGTDLLIDCLNEINLEAELSFLRERHIVNTNEINEEDEEKENLQEETSLTYQDVKRARIFENFLATGSDLSSMILSVLPVLPPNLRPLVEIGDSKLVSSDANEFYRSIVTRSLRLGAAYEGDKGKSVFLMVPEFIVRENKKLIQEGVDCLIDNARLPQSKILSLNDRPLKSLTETLEGKEGRFRQNLLGKRVDYSARSVIVVGPYLRLNQCGLPYDIAVKLFEAPLLRALCDADIDIPTNNTKIANLVIKRRHLIIWKLLEKITRENAVILNRAPTLHKFGIQAFNPVLILGQAIHLHPLVCTGFNADFDGDQMAVHLPLSQMSQLESNALMRPSNNILSPANGDVILKPTQDMVIGSYYLSLMANDVEKNVKKYFASEDDALSAFYCKALNLHDIIFVKYNLSNYLRVENDEAFLFQELNSLSVTKISLHKILYSAKNKKKIYLLTNLGIMTAFLLKKDIYLLENVYVQTTVGRVVFTNNLKNVFEKLDLL